MNGLDRGASFLAAVATDSWSYIGSAWIISAAVLVAYAVAVTRRGRSVARHVPVDERRWMTSRQPASDDRETREHRDSE